MVCELEEAAAPESEEFEVSAKSTVHRQLVSLCPSPVTLQGNTAYLSGHPSSGRVGAV